MSATETHAAPAPATETKKKKAGGRPPKDPADAATGRIMLILRPAQQEDIQQALPFFQQLVLHPQISEHMPEIGLLKSNFKLQECLSQNKMLTTAVEFYLHRMLETAHKLGIDPG